MIPKLFSGRTGHHNAFRGAGRGMSGGRWGRELRNGYQMMHNPIRTIRCWNRSNNKHLINGTLDQMQLKNIRDSREVVKYNYPQNCCRCCWHIG